MKHNLLKRICSGIMVLTMLLSMLPAAAFAQETDTTVPDVTTLTEETQPAVTEVTQAQENQPAPEETTQTEATETTEGEQTPVTSGDAATAEALEAALAAGWTSIRITADFAIDRTFYVAQSTTIYTDEAHTLTRAADFAGDVFVVGETAEGVICESQVVLTLGDPASEAEDLLVIDGNKANMTVDVKGTVVFVCKDHQADLHPNVTIRDSKKVGNERSANTDKYSLSSYPDMVGGAAGIVTNGAALNIFGGKYSGNESNTGAEASSSYGGAFFNHGTMSVYGGVIEGGNALRAAAIYNYRSLYLYNGTIKDNHATAIGGAIYMPASNLAVLYVGLENDVVADGKVVFSGNSCDSSAGALFSQAVNTVVIENAEFTENTAVGNGGAYYAQGNIQIRNTVFSKNSSGKYGGAIFSNGEGTVLSISGCTFEENTADTYGGAIFTGQQLNVADSQFRENVSTSNGGALYMDAAIAKITGSTFEKNESTAGHGGAIAVMAANENAENVELMMIGADLLNNTANQNGGGMYVANGARVYMREVDFTENHAESVADGSYGGGAIYGTNGKIEMNYGSFNWNTTAKRGGALSLFSTSEAVLNNVTANGNSAELVGGFACANKSDLTIYNSKIEHSSAPTGGAIEYQGGSSGCLYGTLFNGNTAETTGGAIHIPAGQTSTVTGETTTFVIHSCQFTNNRSTNPDTTSQGGAIRTTGKTLLDLYNVTAYNNHAYRGGFYYTTTTGTNTTISGLTVFGNTAGNGGPIIWSNSAGVRVYLNKANFKDRALSGTPEDTYWDTLIANQPSVLVESDAAVPEYTDYLPPAFDPDAPNQPEEPEEPTEPEETLPPEDPGLSVKDVATAQELADALAGDKNNIRITADITLDRTYYITRNITIFSEEAHTLTQADDFAGDLFVVGQDELGNVSTGTVVLTLGDDRSAEKDMLIINGNSENMTVDVTGSVLQICGTANVNLYENVTVTNCVKSGDGAVAQLTGKGALNVYGGNYTANQATGNGGVISSSGTVTVYGGTFNGNSAVNGGVVYSTGKVILHGGEMIGNSATDGGAVYTAAKLTTYGGSFTGNSAASGGAVYGAGGEIDANSTGFSGNAATQHGGAIYVSGGSVNAKDADFTDNTAGGNGGAVYVDGGSLCTEDAVFSGNTANLSGGAAWVGSGEASAVNTVFTGNTAENNGGAVCLTSSTFASEAGQMTGNRATYGGAIYAKTSQLQINGTGFADNSSDYYGGAVALFVSSEAEMTGILAEGNTAVYSGGFLYSHNSTLELADSQIRKNSSDRTGGALALNAGAVTTVTATTFAENAAVTDGGAVYATTGGTQTDLAGCTFSGNSADGNGGALYAGSASAVNLSQATAENNTADKGAVLYETDKNTVVTIDGITVSGNTAATSGSVVYGATEDAQLNIDKNDYVDLAVEQITDEYWSAAIVNKITVNDISDPAEELEEENIGGMTNVVKVTSAKQLDAALNSNRQFIRIAEDFAIDRTYYITYDVTIFSTDRRVLTRDPNFGGDIFVIGEDSEGNSVLNTANAKLTLGNPNSKTEDLLVIDGNRDNMAVPVNGAVLFMAYSAQADLYPNLTVQNAAKVGNERVLNETAYVYTSSYRAGGAVAMVMSGTLNIYGGNYNNNSCSENDPNAEVKNANTYGGAIFNYGNVNIYGGTFSGNYAQIGAVMCSYRISRIYGGSFIGNETAGDGGVFYFPSSVSGHTIIGSKDEGGSKVLFEGNKAGTNGGAIHSGTMSSLIIYGNTTFKNNVAVNNNGGAIYTPGQLTLQGVTFEGNRCGSKGGAVYVCNDANGNVTRHVKIENCEFRENVGPRGGALGIYAATADLTGAIVNVNNCTFNKNRSESESGQICGGAIYIERKSKLTVTGSSFTENTSTNEAGAIFIGGESEVSISTTSFTGNSSAGNAGAISIHSAYLDLDNITMEENTADGNGAALYISYTNALDLNSEVSVTNSSLTNNRAEGNGGAMYITKKAVTKEKQILEVLNTDFAYNYAGSHGGAMMLQPGVQVYMYKTTFLQNTAAAKKAKGGAIFANGGILEIDDAVFSQNEAGYGGALQLDNGASAVLNNVTAASNTARLEGGFVHADASSLTVYSSSFKNNTAIGGAVLYGVAEAVTKVYDTVFDGNRATNNAGAVYVYTNADTLLQNCTVNNNTAENNGGAFYVSQAGKLSLYNVEAKNNTGKYGGLLYETVAGTTVVANGLTVSGNAATTAGPIFFGNNDECVLQLNKANYVDADMAEELTEEYWAGAIANKVIVQDCTDPIPSYTPYVSKQKQEETNPEEKVPGSVKDVFDLSQSSSDEDINEIYAAFPKLDNSSNFMSRHTSVYEDVCGGVTVDTFVSYAKKPEGNGQVGLGLLIFQAMMYKQANPDEEVYIDVSAYRLSTQCAVNINRNSRYFGYMRDLQDREYDEYGFVRIAYLLVSAAKMGIHVTAIGHLDGYPRVSSALGLKKYFTYKYSESCDPEYAEGVIGDYLNFQFCYWTLDEKGGTDMMHTKMCAVSDYLDMNGVAHHDAIWTSSSNIDGITAKGCNANNNLQTSTIITNHPDLYRVASNYLRLIAANCEQEQIFEFQDLVNTRSKEQIDLINAGKESMIPANEQLVYLGGEDDDVFELYFTPFGGSNNVWENEYNPYCKYLQKLYDSEDYILMTWSVASYDSTFPLGKQVEKAVSDAFHVNKDPRNKLYLVAGGFDTTVFDDLRVGVDIGYMALNKKAFGSVHNKDVQVSYVENGQRYFVTLHNSLNFHGGSMAYQSNFVLVIKDKTCDEDNVFSTFARLTTSGDIAAHTYGEWEQTLAPTETTLGEQTRECAICGKEEIRKVDAGGNVIEPDPEKPDAPGGENPFVDVEKGMYFYEPVLWAFHNGITTGSDATHFNPGGECTRAQAVTFLWRAAGKPKPMSSENPFKDVAAGAYYYDAVLWAVEQGITNGMSADAFAPDASCTRGQIVTFLWRYGYCPEPENMDNPFSDTNVTEYYGKAMLWAVEQGITNGFPDGTFGPSQTCTRDQIVTFLHRAIVK